MEKYPTVEEYEKYMKILKWRIDETFKNMRSLKKEIEVSNMSYEEWVEWQSGRRKTK